MKNKGLAATELIAIIFIAFILIGGLILALLPQARTKNFGGNTTITLDPGLKLEEITWKDESLWYLTRPMREDESAETHTFKESSNMGIMEGTVTIIEQNEE